MLRSVLVSLCIGLSATSSYAGGAAVCLWSPDRESFSQPVSYTYRWCTREKCREWTKNFLSSLSDPYERASHYLDLDSELFFYTQEPSFYIKFDSSFEDGYQEQKYKLDPAYFNQLKGNVAEICASKAAYKFVLTGNGIDLKKGCPSDASSC